MPPRDDYRYDYWKMFIEVPEAVTLKPPNYKENFIKREGSFYKVDSIKDIFQNGPATILVTIGGGKTVVKSGLERFNSVLGVCMVLLRYLYSPKIYSELVQRIFGYSDEVYMQIGAAEIAIVAKIGEDDYRDILNTFIKKEHEKGKKACK